MTNLHEHPLSKSWAVGFEHPRIDAEEWRSTPERHFYVHGYFEGTNARFSFYFPDASRYQGRFFQHFSPVPDIETRAQELTGQEDRIGFAFSAGGYFIETNEGGTSGGPGTDTDATIAGYRVNAAAATFSRDVATRIYGGHRPFGYAYGGSGGAFRTFGAAENTDGVWDGFVPYVAGSPMAAPNGFTVRMHAQRVLRSSLDQISDAVDVGGSGDPYAGLTQDEAAALREVTSMGFPLRSWFGHKTMGTQAFGVLYPAVVAADPDYFEAFWNTPGYLGADPLASVRSDRVRFEAIVAQVVRRADRLDLGEFSEHPAGPGGGVDEAFKGGDAAGRAVVALRLERASLEWVRGAEMTVLSGKSRGASASLRGVSGKLAVIDFPELDDRIWDINSGDRIRIDNSNFLAAQTYHRHQVPGSEYYVYDQFRDSTGRPIPPQRPFLLAPMFAAGAAGHVPSGKFNGKLILVESLLDREAFPWQADWYRSRALEYHSDDLDSRFRLWYTDNALHGDLEAQEHPTRTVSYLGVLHEALLALVAWVEKDVTPPASTKYSIVDGQVIVPAAAHVRLGVQPTIELSVNGRDRVEVRSGDEFTVKLIAEVPDEAGWIVAVNWDLDGDEVFERTSMPAVGKSVVQTERVRFVTPGTYFVGARVSSHRNADTTASYARIDNVARVRVVVR